MADSVFDTEIYQELKAKYGEGLKNLSNEEKSRINSLLNIPCALPGDFDGTLEAWLLRISIWGKIKITHINPDNDIKRTITTGQFLEYIDDQVRNEAYGLFDVEEVELNKIRFYRKFMGIYGKDITEEIIVDIDLRSDLKAAIKKVRRDNSLFGKFKRLFK